MATTQNEWVRLKLRELLMRGEFQPGFHLQEIPLAEKLGVSRTPVRLALGALAQEGLLIHTPQRGFVVRSFTIKEITDAIAVRGQLEAMAAGLVARQGIGAEHRKTIETALEESILLLGADEITADDLEPWFHNNSTFHNTIVAAAQNVTLERMLDQIESVPLAPAGIVAATLQNLPRIREVFMTSNMMHSWVFDAIVNRQPDRAAYLMREHVHQGREGLRRFLESLRGKRREERKDVFRLVTDDDHAESVTD